MHHYQHHIGDYRRDTMHLTLLEHGCYRQLLDMYYLAEEPIPEETQTVFRRLCARTEEEQNAIQTVLKEFFTLTQDGWVHARCEKEIEAYSAKCARNQEAGKLGGRPKKTQTVISGFENGTQKNPNQEPLTINQEPEGKPQGVSEPGKPGCPPCPIEEIISAYHEILPTLPKVRIRTAKRDSQIRARWRKFFEEGDFETKEGGIDCFKWLFESKVKPSKFLTGQTQPTNGRKPFVADLEWITNESNFAKIVEGRYEHQN